MTDSSWYSMLPPVLAIILAIWTRQGLLSLFAGLWIGYTLLNGYNPLAGVTEGLEGMVNVFADPGDTRVLIFTLLLGSLISTVELAAAVSGAVFGDHASPISDTTVVASMASATDHIDHVRTQLPYACWRRRWPR